MDREEVFNKWRERSKNIQDCHYDTAAALNFLHYMTGVPLVILSAVSASNTWAEAEIFVLFKPYSGLTASFIALLVTILAAIQAFLGFEKRSELHSKAGVQYGAIKREIELMTNYDDKKKLSELCTRWNTLTDESPIIPMRIWRRNEKKKRKSLGIKFEKAPPGCSTYAPTHAGGVVIRKEGATIQYLVVQSSREPLEWVLPKGHIASGESMEQAAQREVLEESGVETIVRDMLDTVEFSVQHERVKAQFFLMEALPGEEAPREGREKRWLNLDDAMQALKYKEAQRLVLQADILLRHMK